MNITSAGHPNHHAHATGHRGGRSNHISNIPIEANRPSIVGTADDATDINVVEPATRHHDGPKGVLDLLQSGHFKGVAAARLSINFHKQLSGLNQETVRTQEGEIDGLQPDIDKINVMSEFSAPNGNGVAFEKFMAIYRDLAGVSVSDDAGATPEAEVNLQA